MPIGEFDKRLVILTKEIGKISAFAKGARRPNGALLACSQPFAFGEFALFAGKSSYTVVSAEISNYFGELREDFEGLCYGFYFSEFSDYLTKENNDEKNILKLLYQTLRAI
jgi:DNA repair protein RecO (recombination protein O)